MSPRPPVIPALLLAGAGLFLASALWGQGVGTGKIPPKQGGPPGYKGPEDISGDGPAPDEGPAPTSGTRPLAPGHPLVPMVPVPTVATPPPEPEFLPPPPDDDTRWILWWRFQRWNRIEAPPRRIPMEPPEVVTPRREAAPDSPGEVRAPGEPAPGSRARRLAARLLRDLLDSKPAQAEVRAAALLALARSAPGPDTEDRLRAALQDGDVRVEETAALALGLQGNPHVLPLLTALVEDAPAGRRALARSRVPPRTRAMAAYGLGLLVRRLPYRTLREAALPALRLGLQPEADAMEDVPAACIQALGAFPGSDAEAVVPDLLAALRERRVPERARAQAPLALARVLAARGEGDLLAREAYGECRRRLLARGEKALVRASCALAVGRFGLLAPFAGDAVEALARARAQDGDPRVRHLAAIGLAEVGAGPHPAGQGRALPILLAGAAQGTDTDRSWDALALGWSMARMREAGRAVPGGLPRRLVGLYPQGNHPQLKAALSLALGLAGHEPAAPTLAAGLRSIGQPILRAEAAAGLALLGGDEALEVVPGEMARTDPLLEAYQVLCAGLAVHAPQALLELLQEGLDASSDTHRHRLAAALGLGWLREPEAVDLLADLLHEDQPFFIRLAAAGSLGRIAEVPGPRWNQVYLDLLNPYAAPRTLVGDPVWPGVADRF